MGVSVRRSGGYRVQGPVQVRGVGQTEGITVSEKSADDLSVVGFVDAYITTHTTVNGSDGYAIMAGDGLEATFTLENAGHSPAPYGYVLWAALYHGDTGAAQKQVLDLQGFAPGLQHPGSVHFDWSEIAPAVTQVSEPDDTWMLALVVTSNLNSIAAEQRLQFAIMPRQA